MLILEIEYSFYLCQMCLSINVQLSYLYNQYSDTNINESINNWYSDNELDDFLLELINAAEFWTDIETAKRNDSLVINYYRLADLIRYMHNIDYLMKKHSLMLENSMVSNPKLCGYQLEDSILLSCTIDSINHTCCITLGNVLFYNDKRRNKSVSVDGGTIVVKFLGTKKLDVKGEISTVVPNINRVYKWNIMKKEDKLLNFSMLVLVGHRQFLLQVIHSDIEVFLYN